MQGSQDAVEVTLALDIGGTFIKSAVFSGGRLVKKLPQIPSCSNGSADEIGAAVAAAVGQAGGITRIAVSIPGPFDYERGVFRMEHKFAAVKDRSFSEFSGGIPATFIHDGNAFLLGELLHGAGRGFSRVGGVTLGTGLGAALAVGGRLLKSPAGSPAAEVGLWNRPYRDGIGEDYVSARALLKKFPAADAKAVEDAAVAGNAQALEAWKEYSSDLYALLAGWKERLEPEVIILGGQLRKGLHLGVPVPAELNIRFSELGEEAALWGAYEAGRDRSASLESPSDELTSRAIVSAGDPALYRPFFERAVRGESLTVGFIGGSITAGASCPVPDKRYPAVLVNWLRAKYPRSRFEQVNAGVGATDSVYGAFRAGRDLLSKAPDLAVIEFSVNDLDRALWAKSYEGLVRQVLARGIAPILLFMTRNHLNNCQRFQEQIGRHYGLAMASFRNALMPELMRGGLRWDDFSRDDVHPNIPGHVFTGKLLCGLLDRMAAVPAPCGAAALPEALFSTEFQHCFIAEGDSFAPEVAGGWRKLPSDETREKLFRGAWFSAEAGSTLSFRFAGGALFISYLGIDGPAGRISVQVDGNPPVLIDGYYPHDWKGARQFWCEVASGLSGGEHRAVVTLLDEHHPDGGTEFYLRGFAGTVIGE